MAPTEYAARALIALGLVALAAGGALLLAQRLGGWPRIPGDVIVQRPGSTIYLPLGSSLVISLLLTFGVALFRLLRR